MSMIIPNDVLTILEKLEHNGYEAYVVGGCVRDTLLRTKRSTIGTLPLQLCPMKCKLYSNMILPLKPEYSTVL